MNYLSAVGRFCAPLLAIVAMTSTAFGQSTLIKALDYDGDHRADLTVFRPSEATWYILKSSGPIMVLPFGLANEDYLTPGDFDGDGLGDIAVWRETTGVWYRINSADFTFYGQQWGLPGDKPVGRDYDADGRTDFGVVRNADNKLTWHIFLQGSNQFYSFAFGLDGDVPIPGDYDGDGRFDFAVQRPGSSPTAPATYHFGLTKTGVYTFFEFGQTKDLVVPGDYDGDGITDLAVVREGVQEQDLLNWYIRLSDSNNAVAHYTFGWTGTDVLVQNDYDGDGRTDIAVWRNTDGRFHILFSSNWAYSVTWWGLPNDIPPATYDTH